MRSWPALAESTSNAKRFGLLMRDSKRSLAVASSVALVEEIVGNATDMSEMSRPEAKLKLLAKEVANVLPFAEIPTFKASSTV
jgi:hypothetical protein